MMDQSKFITNKYGLKETVIDSFADKVARPDHLEWWVDREDAIGKWNSIISKAQSSSTNFIQFIIGNYGRGKTLSLLKISWDQKENKQIYSIYLNLKGEEKSTAGLDLILRIFRAINFNDLSRDVNVDQLKKIIQSLPEMFAELKQVLWKIYFGNLDEKQVNLFPIQNMPKNTTRDLAINYLRGFISPTSAQLKELGILKKLDKIDIAKEYLNGIIFFMRKLGYKSFQICIDEFESLFSLVTKNQQSTYIALLRSIYDFPQNPIQKNDVVNFILFIGISEAGWDSLQDMQKKEDVIGGPTGPLLERLEKPIVLTTFNVTQTEELIEKRLKFNRVDMRFEEEPLIPFTKDFVEYIYNITNGEPRAILVRTSHVLDAGLAARTVKLDAKFAKKVLQERGFVPE